MDSCARTKLIHFDIDACVILSYTGAMEAIHHGTNARVDVLARLDLTKSNMQSSLHTLKEAANWAALVRDVELKFSDGDLLGVTEGWEGLLRSLAVLRHMPAADDRSVFVSFPTDVGVRMWLLVVP